MTFFIATYLPPPLKNALKEQLAMKMATHVLPLALSMNLMVYLFLARVRHVTFFMFQSFKPSKGPNTFTT